MKIRPMRVHWFNLDRNDNANNCFVKAPTEERIKMRQISVKVIGERDKNKEKEKGEYSREKEIKRREERKEERKKEK